MEHINQHIPTGYKPSPLGIIPEDWEVKRLGEVCNFLDSQRVPIKDGDRVKMQGKYPYYGASGIIDYVNDYLFDDDLILLGEDGANILTRSTPLAFLVSGKVWVNNHAHVLKTSTNHNRYYICNYLESLSYDKYNTGTAQPKLNREICENIPILLPNIYEQNKIADILQLWDTAISKQTALIEKLTLRKRGLMQQLLTGKKRLKGFEGEWKTKELGDALSYIQPTKYLVVSENYNNTYKTPVLTAGKTFILGYTDETTGVFNDLPAIIFDDFTTESKYVTFPFKAKSSAMKILKAHNSNLYFMFCAMQMIKYSIGGHERHWISKFSHITLKVPSLEEQNAIASVLVNADKEIEMAKNKLSHLQEQKRGLMQVLLTGKKRVK